MSIYREIPCCAGDANFEPIEFFCGLHLAPQPRGVGQPKSEVQHVVLIVFSLRDAIIVLLVLYDDVAGGAGQRPLAST